MRNRAGTLLLVAASFAVALLMAEGILRLFPGLMSEGATVRLHWQTAGRGDPVSPHDYIGIVPLPEGRAIGEDASDASVESIWAQRNLPPWPGQAEIIVVGDSFAYSQTVTLEHAWTVLLDEARPASRVITLGTVGSGPEQYSRVFETYGVNLSPKLVIVSLFLANDIYDAETFERWQREAPDVDYGRFVEVGAASDAVFWLSRFSGKSYLLALSRDLLSSIADGRLFEGETIELESGERIQIVPQFLFNTAEKVSRRDPGFNLTADSLSRINERARALDMNCLVVLFPSKEEIYGQFLERDFPLLSHSIIAELEQRDIDYFDLAPVFRENAQEGQALYHEVDGHPNILGYQLVAETIAEYLNQHALEYGIDIEVPGELKRE
jgi:hypothetical protein